MANSEEKQDRFRRVAGGRTNRIIEQIRLLGNCANRSNYEYSNEEVRKIFDTIEKEIKNTKTMFHINNKSKKFEL